MWSASSHPPPQKLSRLFWHQLGTLLGTSGNDRSSGHIDLLNALEQERKRKTGRSRRVAEQRSLPRWVLTFTETAPGLGCLYGRLVPPHSPPKSIYSGERWHFGTASCGPFYVLLPPGSQMLWTWNGVCCPMGTHFLSQAGAVWQDHLKTVVCSWGGGALALPGSSTMFLLLPFDSLIVNLLGISLTVLFTLLLVFIIVPAIFGVSFGIRKLYMKTLLKIFAVSCAVYKWLLHQGGKKCCYISKDFFLSGRLLSLDCIQRKLGEWEVASWVNNFPRCVLVKASSKLSFRAKVLGYLILVSKGTYSISPHLAYLF